MPPSLTLEQNTSVSASISSSQLDSLIACADKAKARAYAPYSNFRVGAALLSADGETTFSGCNVENSSYGLTICAERVAVFSAAAAGHTKFSAIVVTSDVEGKFTYPCGACRQVMSEFGVDGNFDVYCLQPNGRVSRTTLKDLLPFAFSKTELELGTGKAGDI
jgi:cytidine deaminase